MQRRSMIAFTVLGAAVALTGCAAPALAQARSAGTLAEIQVIDRTTGEVLPIYRHQGRRYVAGTPGNRYAIAVRNASGARVMTVMSVDGVNVVTGETAAWDQNGYVFAPWQRWEVRGWRKSEQQVAAFEFTSLADSYAARTGRPQQVGVIGVAVFRERVRLPVQTVPQVLRSQEADRVRDGSDAVGRGAADAAPSAAAPAPAREAQGASRSPEGVAARQESSRLGTGHGRTESSWVSTTEFERARPMPDEVITLHYDSRERLLALGVIPVPVQPNPFPGSLGFVPDPPPR
jgi:hypothetical protein